METKIVNDYFLLAINPKRGSYFNMGNEFFYGLTGALVADLYLEGKIGFKLKYIALLNGEPTGFSFCDRALLFIRNRKFPIKAYGLVSRLGFRARSYKKEIVRHLLAKKLIIGVRKKFLFIPYMRYFPADRDARMELVRRTRDILLRGAAFSNEELALLVLIQASSLYRALSDQRAERRLMRQRYKEIIRDEKNKDPNLVLLGEVVKRAIISANAARSAAT